MNWRRRIGGAASVWLACCLPVLGDEVSEAKAKFGAADDEMNAVYGELEESLTEWNMNKLREEQRAWLDYRDYRSKAAAVYDGRAEEGNEEAVVEYWEFMASLTGERIKMLGAWKNPGSGDDWSGRWTDGRGGVLKIAQDGKGTFRFLLHVVRGPTYHLGGIAGEARINESRARFSDKADDAEKVKDEGETWLSFKLKPPHLVVEGTNTGYYHGVRAYFDGTYLRVGTLDDKQRAEVLTGELDAE